MIALIVFLLCGSLACGTSAGTKEARFVRKTVQAGGGKYPYIIYVPAGYDRTRSWPVILFLHGAGERGNNGSQIEVGLGPAIRKHPERFKEVIVVFPQAPANTRWIGEPAQAAMKALDQTILEMNGDSKRVYLTGISMGGYGTWHLAIEYPERFAALVPVCGGILAPSGVRAVRQLPLTNGESDPFKVAAKAIPRIPIWIFHGAEDRVIPVSESRSMFQELKKINANVRYTEYAGVEHNSWDRAYAEKKLWNWMLTKR